ncbi:MAG: acyl-CoA dehydrogenase, partial [Chloroflexi bacterium]|nr:acyl-CoA dehydrogenase [Chloroflexota bacterium]
MKMELTVPQKEAQSAFKAFADQEIFPYANQFDQEECIPAGLIDNMGQRGYLGTMLPQEFGGLDLDMISYGLLNEEIGRACSSTRSLITVQGMVEYALLRWGRGGQKERWLPRLATGELIGVFALTEPETGSDARKIKTEATKTDDGFVLNGRKKWITFAQIAGLFLIFAQCG